MNRRDILTAYKQGLVSTEEVIHRLKSMAGPHGLSEGQKGLWWLARMQPDSSAYHVPFGWALQGSGEAGFWQQVLDALVKQHPMLDSLIRVGPDGEATQVEAASGRARLQEHDIRALAPDDVLPYLRRLVRQRMPLQDGPPMRAHLLHRESEHIVLLVVHHIVCDGQSFQLLTRSLADIASQVARGEVPKVQPPAARYADFVAWERALLASDAGNRHLAYWRGQLAQPLPVLELPGDLPRHLSQRDQGRTHALRIDDASRQRIRALASELRVSPAVFFLAVYKLLLQRYSGQRDLIVGVPDVGRPEPRFEQLVGYFINMVPVRSRLDPQESFAHFARALQLTLADGLEHAAYPFAALMRHLKVPRHAGQSPVFQVAYEYQSASVVGEAPGGGSDSGAGDSGAAAVRRVQGLNQEGEYELVLEVQEHTDGFGLHIKHDPQLFSAGYIERLGRHLLNLVRSVLDEPQLALHRHGMLGPDERQQLLVDWNRTGSDYPRQQCTHELFAKQARYTPDAPALSFQDQTLSYRELDSRANALARHLRACGVQPRQLVGVCIERSLDLVVGLLAIWKAGAAYLPLDPDYPPERLRHMLQDSRAPHVLTQRGLLARVQALLPSLGAALCIDDAWHEGEPLDAHAASPDDLAYVIYTSGSTGLPKGVMVGHRGVTNFLASMAAQPGLTPQDRLLAITTLSFDIAALELYLPLVQGAHCLLASNAQAKDPKLLMAEIRRSRPTVMQATPATWRMLFQSGWKNEERVQILCGGEALPEALRQQFIATDSEAWNLFGPTETTVWSTLSRVTADQPTTIGAPIANTQVYVLDAMQQPLPVMVPGELYIGGDGVAHGYLNRPELTAERFIDDPFSEGAGGQARKLYRTGDLVRWREDGQLEYLERLDHQVKLRGYRIELGEIESVLSRQEGVHAAAVVVREDQGAKQLVAYCTGERLRPQALRERLKGSLPEYMVPAHVVVVPAFPLTPSGKVDRKALASQALQQAEAEEPSAAAGEAGSTEARMLAIWREVLKSRSVGATDGFFDSGGDSMLAVTLAQRIEQAFGCEFSVTDVFRHGHARNMARQIDSATGQEPATATAAQPQAARGPLDESLAIIGISCLFPGAEDHLAFWENLRSGVESVRLLDEEELHAHGVPEALMRQPGFVPVHAGIEGRDLFDPEFFKLTAPQAQAMDPQMRLLLQHSWKAIEDAGYRPQDIADAGVYMATSHNGYHLVAGHAAQAAQLPHDDYLAWVLGQPGTAPTLVAHKLGLKGPSYAVHSNCSSSLVALHTAFQAIRSGQMRHALVGAATVFPRPMVGYVHQKGMNFSSTGHVKAFDASADGMVGGEGVAVLLVKQAARALADGDNIYALVRGVALNNDGADKAGYYAPSVQAQAEVIGQALKVSGVAAQTIGYVEAHGTGTALGDPIEFAALREAYGRHVDKRQACGVGSVKTNIGHLDTAAGLAGCVKLALSLQHGELPATLNYATPNPALGIESSPFFVVDRHQPWPTGNGTPRRGAISSFGIGGTNGHAVFEEAPEPRAARLQEPASSESAFVVPLSARSPGALKRQATALAAFVHRHLEEAGETALLRDLAYTLQVGREAMECRAAFVVTSMRDLARALDAFAQGAGPQMPAAAPQHLRQLAHAWAAGGEADWRSLYTSGKPRRMSLPTYSFEQAHCGLPLPAVQAAGALRQALAAPSATEDAHIVRTVRAELALLVGKPPEEIDVDAPFGRYAIDSIASIKLVNGLNRQLGIDLSVTALYEHDCVSKLARHLKGDPAGQGAMRSPVVAAAPSATPPTAGEPVAIIAVSGRYPQAPTVERYWENLAAGRDVVTEIPSTRWPLDGFYNPDPAEAQQRFQSRCKHGAFLDDVEGVDAARFGVRPEEAKYVNPRELLFLDTTQKLLESAGYARDELARACGGQVGVFVGAVPGTQHYFGVGSPKNSPIPPMSVSGIASRVSSHFNLNGPSLAVDTQSSSSLAAIHMACTSLARGECQMAIAGGVTLLHPELYLVYQATGILATQASSRSFMAGDGAIPAEAVGAVLLKPLSRALADGDTVHAVIRSSAMRHAGEGGGPAGPNLQAQVALFEEVLAAGGIDARTVSYVEAAANGARLGDAIELAALSKVFGRSAQEQGWCAVGSAKSGMGHAEAASGIASLTKVVMQLVHRQLAPLAIDGPLNPDIRLAGSPLRLQRELQPWARPARAADGREHPRRALVNSFGAGGVYVSVLVEEHDAGAPSAVQAVPAAATQTATAHARPPRLAAGSNLHRMNLAVSRASRQKLNGHSGKVVWFTGLSGAGKSTLANAADQRLHRQGIRTYLLDGDNLRLGINKDLGFTEGDRRENIRRTAEVARLMADAGLVVLASLISPFRADRLLARQLVGEEGFVEVFVDVPLDVAESRDPKGLYRKARRGELPHFTGITSPYERPETPEIHVETSRIDLEAAADALVSSLAACRPGNPTIHIA